MKLGSGCDLGLLSPGICASLEFATETYGKELSYVMSNFLTGVVSSQQLWQPLSVSTGSVFTMLGSRFHDGWPRCARWLWAYFLEIQPRIHFSISYLIPAMDPFPPNGAKENPGLCQRTLPDTLGWQKVGVVAGGVEEPWEVYVS